jgi:hypothetical protein
MKYWKKIKYNDTVKPGDIIMCISPAYKNGAVVVVQTCSEMTGITDVIYIKNAGLIQAYWSFSYMVTYCKKLIIV